LPHRVQASSMSSTRPPRAVSKEMSFITADPSLRPVRMNYQRRGAMLTLGA
jgi:hypothetical protein